MLKTLQALAIVLIPIIFVGCAASPGMESTGEYLDSSAITAKVKTRLVDSLGTKAFSIKVKTFKDQVQLSGFVDNRFIKQKAGQAAADVDSVKRVINNIIVK